MKKIILDLVKAITLVGGFFGAILGMKGEMWGLAVMFLCFFAFTATINCEESDSDTNNNEKED